MGRVAAITCRDGVMPHGQTVFKEGRLTAGTHGKVVPNQRPGAYTAFPECYSPPRGPRDWRSPAQHRRRKKKALEIGGWISLGGDGGCRRRRDGDRVCLAAGASVRVRGCHREA